MTASTSERRRVVITGLGAVTDIGNDVDSFWQGLVTGRSGIGAITAFEQDDRWTTQIAGEIRDWDPTDLVPKSEHKKMDRVTLIGLHAALQAARDSGFDFDSGDPYRHGVVFGTGIGGIITGHHRAAADAEAELSVVTRERSFQPEALAPILPTRVATEDVKQAVNTVLMPRYLKHHAAMADARKKLKRGEITPVEMKAITHASGREFDTKYAQTIEAAKAIANADGEVPLQRLKKWQASLLTSAESLKRRL
mgnify:CR=1 FL=1